MQSRDRAAPLHRARRGLAGDRRRHHPRALTPPPHALTLRHRRRRRSPHRAACPTRPDTQYASYILETPRAGWRVGYDHRLLLHFLLPLLLLLRLHGRYIYVDSTRRRPPSATSIMTPARRNVRSCLLCCRPLSYRGNAAGRVTRACVCARVCLRERGG